MTTSDFYCDECFADRESDCICDRIVGYDVVTGYPCVYMTDEEPIVQWNRKSGR